MRILATYPHDFGWGSTFMNGCKESIALINAMLEKSSRRNTTVSIFTLDRICSDLLGIGSTMVWIHSIYTGLVGKKNSMILYCITFISGPIWYQIADSIHTGSTRSHVNTRLVCLYQFPDILTKQKRGISFISFTTWGFLLNQCSLICNIRVVICKLNLVFYF